MTASEDDGRATLVVSLSEAYHLPVSVSYSVVVAASTATRGVDYALADGTLTFNPRTAGGAGDREKQIVITLFQDSLNEDNERVVIRLTGLTNAVSSGADLATLIITDSNAPPTVRLVGAGQSVAESGGSAAFTVELNQVSDLPVAVPYTVAGTASPGDAALGTGDHNLRSGVVIVPAGATSARVRFTIVDDRIDEDDETVRIRLGTPINADLVSPTEHVVTIVDDDTAGVNLSGRAFTLQEGEGATYSVTLNSQPTRNVTVRLEPDGQLRVNGADRATLSFTPLNWSQPQTVTLKAFDDFVDEDDPHPGLLRHVVDSADPRYNRIDQRPAGSLDVRVTIRDNDTAGVLIAPASATLTITEGLTGTYSVRLTSQPTAPVTVTVTTDDEVTASPTALVFDATNWNQPRTVTVTAVDDAVDEDGDGNLSLHAGLLAHTVTSADPRYNGIDQRPAGSLDVRVTIRDNDTAGVLIAPASATLTITEGLTGTYTVRLTSQPTAPVTVTVTTDDEVTASPTALVFDATNWNQPRTVTVTAEDDAVDEDGDGNLSLHTGLVAHTVTSADPIYAALPGPARPANVTVRIRDNDTAGVLIAPATTPFTVTEGLTGTYTVRLTSEPTDTVRITLGITGSDQIALTPAQLTFEETSWTEPQTVTVTALDNDVIDGARAVTIAHAADTSDDPVYAGLAPLSLTVAIADDDVAGLRLTPGALALSEGAPGPTTGTYTVTLTSRPAYTVTVALAITATAQITVAPLQLEFAPEFWNQPQTVSVTAIQDAVAEAPTQTLTIRHSASSLGDTNYNGLPPVDKTVTVADDDVAGVLITPLDGTAPISETTGFNTSQFAVELTSEPTGPVTVTLAPDAQVTVSEPTLGFDAATWSSAQVITVTAVDDALAETTPHTGTIGLSSASEDPSYSQAWPAYEVRIADDDQAVVGVSAVSGAATSESGGEVSFQIWLLSEPTAPVTIPITLSAGAEAELSVAAPWGLPLVFTRDNWRTVVTVTIKGIDDDDYDGPRPFAVSIGNAQSPGGGYDGVAPAQRQIELWNDDDEPPQVAVGDAPALDEGLAGEALAQFPVTLHRAAPVTVTVGYATYGMTATEGEDYWPTSGAITFTPGVTSGLIEVPVLGDAAYEPDELFGLRLTGVSAEGEAVELGDADAIGTVRNDDAAGVRFERAETIVAEGAGEAPVVVRLDEPQGGEVRVDYRTLSPGDGGGTAVEGEDFAPQSGTLIFPPGVVAQTVGLAIVDGDVAEGLYETVRLELSGPSGAPLGNPYTATVTIVDDDGPAPLEAEPFLVTGGPDTLPTSAYFYTGDERGYGYAIISVPCSWPSDRALTIELWSPAMHWSGSPDRVGRDGVLDDTSFELYDLGAGARSAALRPAPGGPGSLLERPFTPSGGVEQWDVYHTIAAPTPCGSYALRFTAHGDDENFWAVRAGFDADGDPATAPDPAGGTDGARVALATLGATVEHRVAPMMTTSWFYVAPGTLELRLRTYDLDRGASGTPQDFGAGVRYYAPGQGYDPEGAAGGSAGTPSVSGWSEDRVSRPAPGWWRAVVSTGSVQNGYVLEAEGDGAPLPIQYEPPAEPLVRLGLTPSATTAAPGERLSLTLSYTSLGPAAYSPTLSVRLPGDLAFDGDPCAGAPGSCSWGADGRLTLTSAGPPEADLAHSFAVVVVAAAQGKAPVALEAAFGDGWGNGYRASTGAVVGVR